jgi:hypothetical protein
MPGITRVCLERHVRDAVDGNAGRDLDKQRRLSL